MPKSRLAATLRAIHAKAARNHAPPNAGVVALGRRALLAGAAATAGLAATGATLFPRAATAGSEARIAVVGAGLAGLAAAYDLAKAGYRATVYEANTRLGGRCWTIRDVFRNGQIAEHGGEFIDTDHHAMRRLAAELGLTLDDVLAAQPKGTEALYYFDGAPYSVADAARDYVPVYPIIQRQTKAAGNYGYQGANAAARALDAISCADWIARYVPGGLGSAFGKLLANAVTEENAADAGRQTSLALLSLFAPDPRHGFDLYYTGSDQRFHVHGGNDQIPNLLGVMLAGQIQTATALVAIAARPDGKFRLTLARDSAVFDEVFDRVVLALPFSVMRRAVDWSRAGFGRLKQQSILTLPMGSSVKFQVQVERRVWWDAGCNGEIRLEAPGFETTWDVTRAQPGETGIFNFWSGGTRAHYAGTTDPARLARQCLERASILLPGLPHAWNGLMTRDYWRQDPWALGSYVYWPLGYATTLAGIEAVPEGNCFFAGEHTSPNYGFMNAAVSTGQRAARQVLASLAG